VFTAPAARPLIAPICLGSPDETFCVMLLSMAQHRHAPATAKGPKRLVSPMLPCHETSALPARMAAIPRVNFLPLCSWKSVHANIAVNTASKLRRREAIEANVVCKPSSRSIGPRIPPKTEAPESQGRSFRVREASKLVFLRRRIQSAARPKPEPR